jgi:hypothetical protein
LATLASAQLTSPLDSIDGSVVTNNSYI